MTNFIFYATKPELFSQEITHIESLLAKFTTKSLIISDRIQLICLIPKLCKESSVVLLFASSDEELEDLVNIKERLGAIPTILILPDDDTETLQRGMLLHPLYFLTQHAELNQFSYAVNELCHIYEGYFDQNTLHSLICEVGVDT